MVMQKIFINKSVLKIAVAPSFNREGSPLYSSSFICFCAGNASSPHFQALLENAQSS